MFGLFVWFVCLVCLLFLLLELFFDFYVDSFNDPQVFQDISKLTVFAQTRIRYTVVPRVTTFCFSPIASDRYLPETLFTSFPPCREQYPLLPPIRLPSSLRLPPPSSHLQKKKNI